VSQLIFLELHVHIDVHVVISFGLEFFASVVIAAFNFVEGNMQNSFAMILKLMASFWCGMAFLRSSGEINSNPNERLMCTDL
jgi:hypothetical protein